MALVNLGSAYDRSTHKIVKVNTETPTTIENDFMIAKIVVRVKGFRGLPSSSPSTSAEYFADPMHARDQYSLGFTFVPKQDIPSVDTVWGNDFDHPVRYALEHSTELHFETNLFRVAGIEYRPVLRLRGHCYRTANSY